MIWFVASLPLLLLTVGSWCLLGLVVVRNVLRIDSGLTVFVLSLPVGMILNLALVNAVARLIFFPISSWIIVLGAIPVSLFFLRRPQPPLNWEISVRQRYVLLSALLLLVLGVFYLNAREIWGDDPGHASMINLMASGEFPLLFQCNPQIRASYGYGGDLLAAVTQVMGGVNSWDAEDVVKAATVASVVMLAFLVGWRHKQKVGAGLLSVFLIFTAAGMLWMYEPLSVAGGRYLAAQTPSLSPLPPAMDTLMSDPGKYTIDTPGFVATSYGYSERSLSWGFAPFVILLFLVTVDTPAPPFTKSLTLGIILAMAGLLHPATLSLLLPGFIILLFFWVRARRRRKFPRLDFNPIWTLVVAFVLMVVQGGQITDTILDKLQGVPNVMTSFMLAPIQLPSCRGETPTLNCALLSVGNLGLVPFLIPILLWLAWRVYKRPGWVIVLMGAIVAMGTTVVTRYAYIDWNIQRLIVFSVWSGAVLLGPVLYESFIHSGLVGKVLVMGTVFIISYSGLLELAVIIDGRYIADATSQNFSPMVDPLELSMMKYATDIPLDARFFDPSGCISAVYSRPAYLFGRYSVSDSSHAGEQTASYTALVTKPSPDLLYQGGYTHVFFDQTWYNKLSLESAQLLRTDPLEVIGWARDAEKFRVLARVCAPDQGCAPQVPGIMEEMVPAQINFENSLALTGFVRSINDEDRTVHVKFRVLALSPMTGNYHFSLRLTRKTDGKIFAVDGIAGTLTTNMVVGATYLANDVTFKDVPPGDYRLSIGWYDINSPDLRPLQIVNPVPPSSNQEATLLSLLKVAYYNSGS